MRGSVTSGKLTRSVEVLREQGVSSLINSVWLYFFEDYIKWKDTLCRYARNKYACEAVADPYKVVWVSPCDITRYSLAFEKWESVCRIEGGDWDLEADPLEELPKYRAVHQRYVNGLSWKETGIYDHMLKRIEKEGVVDECTTKPELEQRYAEIDELYESIRSGGYDSTYDLAPPRWWRFRDLDYIAVHIGRDGELIFGGSGCHRLAITHILGIERIPVWIRARHEQWQQIRDRMSRAISVDNRGEELARHSSHPDLRNIVPDRPRTPHDSIPD